MSGAVGKGDWVQAVRATAATSYGIAAVAIGEVHRVAKLVQIPAHAIVIGCRHCGETGSVGLLIDADEPNIHGSRCPCGWRPLGFGKAGLSPPRLVGVPEAVDA